MVMAASPDPRSNYRFEAIIPMSDAQWIADRTIIGLTRQTDSEHGICLYALDGEKLDLRSSRGIILSDGPSAVVLHPEIEADLKAANGPQPGEAFEEEDDDETDGALISEEQTARLRGLISKSLRKLPRKEALQPSRSC